MTTVGPVPMTAPATYNRDGYNVNIACAQADADLFNQMRELFSKAIFGTSIKAIPGARPWGQDHTDELKNTQYVAFTHGTPGKPQDGYYLLRPDFSFVEDESPIGHSYVFTIPLFFLGTTAYYQPAILVKGMTDVEDEIDENDWLI